MGKALDFRAEGPRLKSHLSQYLYNFYRKFLNSGITKHSQIMCFLDILRSRAFRIYGQSVWELKINKIRRQGTVQDSSVMYLDKLNSKKIPLYEQKFNSKYIKYIRYSTISVHSLNSVRHVKTQVSLKFNQQQKHC